MADVRLLHGPYRPPRLRVGHRATCLYRDCDVIVTAWSDGPISWPRGLPVGQGQRGGPSLLVDDELLRAIRSESAVALRHWWHVSVGMVWKWRKTFGIGRTGTPGSARLVRAAAQLGAEAIKAKEWTEAEREQKRELAIKGNFGHNGQQGYHGPRWTDDELALLGTDADDVIAQRIGKSRDAVRAQRVRQGKRK